MWHTGEIPAQGQPVAGQPSPFSMSASKQWRVRNTHTPSNVVTLAKMCHPPQQGFHPAIHLTPSPPPPLPTLRPPQLLPQVQLMILLHSSWINRSHNHKELTPLLATTSSHLSAFVLEAEEDSLSHLRPDPAQELWVLPLSFSQTRPLTHSSLTPSPYEIINLACI